MTIMDKIIDLLKKTPSGLAYHQIAEKVGVSRVTVSKYIAILDAEKKIRIDDFATAKIVYWKG